MKEFRFHATCERRSTSLAQVHCTTCCETFSGYRAFDEHRQVTPKSKGGDGVDRVCADPASLHRKNGDPVLFADVAVHGTVWRQWPPRTRDLPERIPDSRPRQCPQAA